MNIIFLVTGKNKATAVWEVWKDKSDPHALSCTIDSVVSIEKQFGISIKQLLNFF